MNEKDLRYQRELTPEMLEGFDLPEESEASNKVCPAAGEVENYCQGLERMLYAKQHELSRCLDELKKYREQTEVNPEIIRLRAERDALNWRVEYDRKYLAEIKGSTAWKIARCIHYAWGGMCLKPPVIREAKNEFGMFLLRQTRQGGPVRRRTALMAHSLLCAVTDAAKKIVPARYCREEQTAIAEKQELKPYLSCYQDDEKIAIDADDIKLITFYLPQFHTFPENDEWWGKGFTEWTNTRKAKPRFPGHYQPRTPHADIGYYDLSDVNTLKRQAEQAKAHGIHAFCLYYYWFDGKKLMEKPLELLMAHPEIDFNFCLCWANENWTRTWDGQEKSILIQQNYSEENDVNFIADLKRYLQDPRYLRCNGRPVVMIYHAKVLPDPERTFSTWRKWCRENGVGEIQIWSCRTFIKNDEFKKFAQVDREVEFPPHMVSPLKMFAPEKFEAFDSTGNFYDYTKIIKDVKNHQTMADHSPYPIYRCAMLGWDNSSRRAHGYSVWQYFSLQTYHFWLRKIIEYTKTNFLPHERFVFINAWNEWAEGTYLEPDEKYGYASINTTTRALCNLPPVPEYEVLSPCPEPVVSPGRILIHLHCFYPELLGEFVEKFNLMPFKYDCVITTTAGKKQKLVKDFLQKNPLKQCGKLKVLAVANIGRDAAPFFEACADCINEYDIVGHFHTKRSLTVNWGAEWRRYLLKNLFGSSGHINAVFRRFERDKELGILFPPQYPAMRNYVNWEKNLDRCKLLLEKMGMDVKLPAKPFFPGGQMFWARTKAISKLFSPEADISARSFENEKNQISDTMAHALERIWTYVAQGSGYTALAACAPFARPEQKDTQDCRRLALYVHYSPDGKVSDCDLYLLKELRKTSEIVFINNGTLAEGEQSKLEPVVKDIILRKNRGYDFSAWKDALAETSLSGYDELVLLNNSIAGPFVPFEDIFAGMQDSDADFWGMTEFPETRNPRREEAKLLPDGIIPRHLQSYFTVFRKKAFESQAFAGFWQSVTDTNSLPEAVARYETKLSNTLEKAGLKSDLYLKSSGALQNIDIIDPSYNALYCRPLDFFSLDFPFLKKNICYYLEQPDINEITHQISVQTDYPAELLKIVHKTRE